MPQHLADTFKLPAIFKKRTGTTDLGKNYEHLYIANLILKLLTDDNVQDFNISSNDESFGSFDDVVVEVKYCDQSQKIFAIQSKHSNTNKALISDALAAFKGNFSIKKYLEDCDQKWLDGSVKFIVLTNMTANLENKTIRVKVDKEQADVNIWQSEQDDLVTTSTEGHCYSFGSDRRKDFFQNFFLYTNQENFSQLETKTSELFQNMFSCGKNVFIEYVDFITRWSLKEGRKYTLNKEWMMRYIFLQVVTPFIRNLSFSYKKAVHNKGLIFRDVVSKFDSVVIDKCRYEDIKELWIDGVKNFDNLVDNDEISKLKSIYHLEVTKLEDLDGEDFNVTKLMWLMKRCPLIVEGCPQVYKAAEVCKQKQLIILDSLVNFQKKMLNNSKFQPTTFQRLSDLEKYNSLFENILDTFTYSLEGQQEVVLKNLIDLDKEFAKWITTDQLVQMLKSPLLMGQDTETLPPCHIERKVLKILISPRYLKNISENTIVTISCITDLENLGQSLPKDTTIVRVEEKSSFNFILWKKGSRLIYVSSDDIQQDLFQNIQLEGLPKIHHFRNLEDKCLEWISTNKNKETYIDELQRFRIDDNKNDHTIHESELLNGNVESSVNIICADPGMGKSTLMRSLKRRTPSSTWSIVIYARNHAKHYRNCEEDVDKFLDHVFHEKFKNNDVESLEYKVFRVLIEKRQIRIIWDGLDEISEKSLHATFTMVDCHSRREVKQWLSCRINLKFILEEKFQIFARNITELEEDEQQEYIKNRLHLGPDELSKIFSKITKNIVSFSNKNILAIPLHIYMLTELIFQNKNKYLNEIGGIFTILLLYQQFVEEKFKVLYVEKLGLNLNIEKNYESYEDKKEQDLNCYKSIASIIYLNDGESQNYNTQCKDFIEEIRKSGDPIGLINFIGRNDLEFSHNSYGEYFTALFLFEKNPLKIRESSFYSDSKYDNIRFFLDLMLSQNLKAFVAVLYKNITLLNQCVEDDFSQKDVIGRSIEEVAFTWLKKAKNDSYLTKAFQKVLPAKITYENILFHFHNMKDNVSFTIKKLFYLEPFLVFFYDYRFHQFNNSYTILYYAIKYDCYDIFNGNGNTLRFDETFKENELREIIYLTLFFNSRNILQKMFNLNKIQREVCLSILPRVLRQLKTINNEMLIWLLNKLNTNLLNLITINDACLGFNSVFVKLMINQGAELNIPNKDGKLPIHASIVSGNDEVTKLLIQEGVRIDIPDVNDGDYPIHKACNYRRFGILELLIQEGSRINVSNARGELPIHKVCKYKNYKPVKLLIENGAKLDIQDSNGELPIHRACNIEENIDIIQLLMDNGAKIDIPDASGRLPIHNACQCYFSFKIVQLLIARGAKIDVPDANGELPLHRACKFDNKTVQLLIDKGAKIDVPDADGQLPIHKACHSSTNIKIVTLLLEKGAKIDIPDANGELPIHKACDNYGGFDTVKLLIEKGAKIDVPNSNGKLPIHKASSYRFDTIKLLLEKGSEIDTLVPNGDWLIHKAFDKEDINIVQLLIEKNANLDIPDLHGKLLIHKAFDSRQIDTLKLIIHKGAQLNTPDENGELLIYKACRNGYIDIMQLLIDNGAKVDIPDANGQFLIHKACSYGNIKSVQLFINNAFKINIPDANGELPIHKACSYGHFVIVQILIENGAEIDVLDTSGNLPIHKALANKHNRVVKLLIGKGTKMNEPDANGELLIHKAFGNKQIELLRLLIESGAKIDIPDASGELPIHKACRLGDVKILQLLLERGARVDVKNVNGQLPIDVARVCKNDKLGQFLC